MQYCEYTSVKISQMLKLKANNEFLRDCKRSNMRSDLDTILLLLFTGERCNLIVDTSPFSEESQWTKFKI